MARRGPQTSERALHEARRDTAVDFMDQAFDLVHQRAQTILLGSPEEEALTKWIYSRMKALGIDPKSGQYTVQPTLNAWNKDGYGLQSVNVEMRDISQPVNSQMVLMSNRSGRADQIGEEWKDPTIGIVTEGMIEGGDVMPAVVDFGIDPTNMERLRAVSQMGVKVQSVDKNMPQTESPLILGQRHITIARGSRNEVMRALMQVGTQVKGAERMSAKLVNGIYVCTYEADQTLEAAA